MNSYRYFHNSECQYYPCHPNANDDNFSCLFCYCPLYWLSVNRELECGGDFNILPNGIKDCSNCLVPHEDYDYILKKLMDYMSKKE